MMTNKEAIEIIKLAITEVEWNYPIDYAAAFNKAIEALGDHLEQRITNKEVLQLFAKYEPELLAECFEDIYCIGYNDCAYHQSLSKDSDASQSPSSYYDAGFDTKWLESEYDTDLFRVQDIDRLLKMQEQENGNQ